jgi:putative Holliday junction resolvase
MTSEVGRVRLLGIDLGDKRIGLAISDPSGTIATPLGFIARRKGKRPPIAELVERARALETTAFVVGLPLDEDGNETARSEEARHIAAELEKRTQMKAHLLDERFTTAAALRAVREMGGSVRGRKGDVDALAATLLVQHALAQKL